MYDFFDCLPLLTIKLFSTAFYLILDIAVGGTNGWFPDGSEKPWLDGSRSESLLY